MNIIKTKDYLLLINKEAEIKKGDWYIDSDNRIVRSLGNEYQMYGIIISYYPLTKEAKEFDLPLLPNWNKNVDVEELAKDFYWKQTNNIIMENSRPDVIIGFVAGYGTAQSGKQFSLEDMKKCFVAGALTDLFNTWNIPKKIYAREKAEQYIQSLSTQQLPKEFIPKYKTLLEGGLVNPIEVIRYCTIMNSEGKEELVGDYIDARINRGI